MKRIGLSFLGAMLFSFGMYAEFPVEIDIDNFTYSLDRETKRATLKKFLGGIEDVVIPAEVSYEGEPYVVVAIGSRAFERHDIQRVKIPDSVTSLGGWAFNICTSLVSVDIGNSVPELLDGCFWGCSQLSSVKLGNSLTLIGSNAFNNCGSLREIEIPSSVRRIAGGAFFNCDGLSDIVIPSSVESIGVNAFYSCDSLASVSLGAGMRLVEPAFDECTAIKEVFCLAGVPPEMVPGVTYKDYFFKASLHVPSGSEKAYSESGGWGAFKTGSSTPLIKAESISLDFQERTIEVGDTIRAGLKILPADASFSSSADWQCSDPSVVSVDPFGNIIALKVGECVLEATTLDGTGLSATCRITIVPKDPTPIAITLDYDEIWVWMQSTRSLNATVTPEGTSYGWIVWSSSNESVARVSALGTVSAVAVGDTEITATIADGNGLSDVSASCLVHVLDRDGVESITDDPESVVEVVDLSGRIVYEGKLGDLPSDVKGMFVVRKRGSGIGRVLIM